MLVIMAARKRRRRKKTWCGLCAFCAFLRPTSFQAKDVLHVVDAGRLAYDPLRRAEGTAGEDAAIAGLVRELEALTERGIHDGVVADDVAAAEGVHADLGRLALAGDSVAP